MIKVMKKNVWVEEIKKELPDDFYEMRKIGEMRITSAS